MPIARLLHCCSFPAKSKTRQGEREKKKKISESAGKHRFGPHLHLTWKMHFLDVLVRMFFPRAKLAPARFLCTVSPILKSGSLHLVLIKMPSLADGKELEWVATEDKDNVQRWFMWLLVLVNLHLRLMCFGSTWFPIRFFLPQSRRPPSLHPLLHLISFSPSIQIVFIGMTGPVVGDSHRHGRTMHCDGDIHMIMPSDSTLLQIHLDSQSAFSVCVDVYDYDVLTLQIILHNTLFSLHVMSQPASLPLWFFSFCPLFCSSVCPFTIFLSPNTMLAITLNPFHSHGFWQYFF